MRKEAEINAEADKKNEKPLKRKTISMSKFSKQKTRKDAEGKNRIITIDEVPNRSGRSEKYRKHRRKKRNMKRLQNLMEQKKALLKKKKKKKKPH